MMTEMVSQSTSNMRLQKAVFVSCCYSKWWAEWWTDTGMHENKRIQARKIQNDTGQAVRESGGELQAVWRW